MTVTLMISLTAFTILYAYLVTLRLRVGRLEERALAEALSPRLGQPASALVAAEDDARHDLPALDDLEEQGAAPVRDVLAHVNDLGYIVAAWVTTAVVLGSYVAILLARARRARLRAVAVVARRDRVRPGPPAPHGRIPRREEGQRDRGPPGRSWGPSVGSPRRACRAASCTTRRRPSSSSRATTAVGERLRLGGLVLPGTVSRSARGRRSS